MWNSLDIVDDSNHVFHSPPVPNYSFLQQNRIYGYLRRLIVPLIGWYAVHVIGTKVLILRNSCSRPGNSFETVQTVDWTRQHWIDELLHFGSSFSNHKYDFASQRMSSLRWNAIDSMKCSKKQDTFESFTIVDSTARRCAWLIALKSVMDMVGWITGAGRKWVPVVWQQKLVRISYDVRSAGCLTDHDDRRARSLSPTNTHHTNR
jgi:hypothetical protein